MSKAGVISREDSKFDLELSGQAVHREVNFELEPERDRLPVQALEMVSVLVEPDKVIEAEEQARFVEVCIFYRYKVQGADNINVAGASHRTQCDY